jgi:hypothetical protein
LFLVSIYNLTNVNRYNPHKQKMSGAIQPLA